MTDAVNHSSIRPLSVLSAFRRPVLRAPAPAASPVQGRLPGGVEEEVVPPLARALAAPCVPRPRPMVPKLSLRGVFKEKEKAGEYKLKMDYKCDDPCDDSDLDTLDDAEAPEISDLQLDEAIEVLLDSRYRIVDGEQANPRAENESFWVRLFGGCLAEECHGNNVKVNQRTPLKSAKTAHSLGVSLERASDII
ncbi:unnamed protein product [Cladocopium goreaui]|uniref:PB1 domain-containing protein n=1 Tax=Cladocopium goreaui TaxID=2562237 RepID=A0A9P1BK87_9DINO|nr:unnamed protein product [Cladocopium goreaui]